MCRDNKVRGHSKKKHPEVIELLLKAGVHPTKGLGTAATVPASATGIASAEAEDTHSVSSQSTTKSHEYVFHAPWENVLPYLDDDHASLVIADPISAEEDVISQLLPHAVRILDAKGILLVNGLTEIPELPTGYELYTTWISVGDAATPTKVLAIHKNPAFTCAPAATGAKTLPKFYEAFLLNHTEPNSTVVLPYATDEKLPALVKKHQRSFVTMSPSEKLVEKFYRV